MTIRETDLYPPIKAYLQARGFDVKAEIGAADVVARQGDDVVIVELKTAFSLTLLQQAVERLAVTDLVYVGVPKSEGRAGWKAFQANIRLCRRLGLGVLTVRMRDGLVEAQADPVPYAPRKSAAKKKTLLREFDRRRGDPNAGGSTRQGIVTAYRQDAEAIARFLLAEGASKGAVAAKATNVPHATRLMADNHYGWFVRVQTGIYDLTDAGRGAVTRAE